MATHLLLISGQKIPTIGFGTAMKHDSTLESLLNTVLEAGYRHIDTASGYQNEEAIGNVLKQWLKSGKLKREDVFITTKLPNHHLHPDKIEDSLKDSLKKLQLDYVDLYLIHQPIYIERIEEAKPVNPGANPGRRGPPPTGKPLPTDHIACWKKLEEQVDAGRVKNIGVSNFNERQIERIWQSARIKPACLQIELSPFLQSPELVKFAQDKGIAVVGYSMVRIPRQEEGKRFNVFENETIKRISEKHGKPPGHIVMRFFIQKNVIPIPGSSNPERIKQNLDMYSFSLDAGDIKALEGLNVGEEARKVNHFKSNPEFVAHPEYPYPK